MNPCAGSAIRKKIKSDITLDVAISFIFMFLKLLSLKQATDNFSIVSAEELHLAHWVITEIRETQILFNDSIYVYLYGNICPRIQMCKNELMRVYTIVNK